MWVHTQHGFYSAVAHRDEPGMLMIRARACRDLEVLKHRHPKILRGVRIDDTPAGDYRWRIVIPAEDWAEIMALESTEIDYDNFKDRIDHTIGPRRHSVLMRVWSALRDIEREDALPDKPIGQPGPRRKGKKGRKAGTRRWADDRPALDDWLCTHPSYHQPRLGDLAGTYRASTRPDNRTPVLDEIRFSDDCTCFERIAEGEYVRCPVHDS